MNHSVFCKIALRNCLKTLCTRNSSHVETFSHSSCYRMQHCRSKGKWYIDRQNEIKLRRQFSVNADYSGVVVSDKLVNNSHIPVLANEVLKSMSLKKNGIYLDLTFGAGGHSKKILEYEPSINLYSLDRDPATVQYAQRMKEEYPDRFYPMTGKFSDLPELLKEHGIFSSYFSGILMDLGASSMQFSSPSRGFMLSKDGPLDMRMDGDRDSNQPTAADVVNFADEESLRRIMKIYGQEQKAKLIARAIVESRSLFKKINTTKELAELVAQVTGEQFRGDKLDRFAHPATKTFQALRIFVNDELNQLDHGIRLAHYYLQLDGILAVISFHSLEDALVKRHFTGADLDMSPESIGKASWKNLDIRMSTFSSEEITQLVPRPWKQLTKHVVIPTEEEVIQNPRARSAKLRAASKLYFDYW